MSIQRERTYIQEGYVSELQFDDGTVTVKTASGQTFNQVPVAGTSLSSKSKTGLHNFPAVGDKCWLTRDANQWHVSHFGPQYNPTGQFVAKRPSLFRPGYQGLHTDLSGIDLLPSAAGTSGSKIYASEKFGLTSSTTNDTLPISSTTTTVASSFTSSVLTRALFPCDICSTTTFPTFTLPKPIVVSSSVGAILVNTGGGTNVVPVTITARNLEKIAEGGVSKVTLTIPGLLPATYALTAVTAGVFDTKGPPVVPGTPGTVAFTVNASLSTPAGVYDVHVANANGSCFKATAAFSINYFTPGPFEISYYETPVGTSLNLASGLQNVSAKGVLFTMRETVGTAILQENDVNNVTDTTIKYVGKSGTFPDFVIGRDRSNAVIDPSVLNSFRLQTITLSEITDPTPPDFFVEIKDTTPAVKNRLESAASTVEIFASDNAKRNRGLLLHNFVSTDSFGIRVYRRFPKAQPNYSDPPRLDACDPAIIRLPQTIFFTINGENMRLGSTFSLVQSREFQNVGTSNEVTVNVASPRILTLGTDATDTVNTIQTSNAPGFVGTATLFKISDRMVGVKLVVTSFPTNMYGIYNVTVSHPNHSPTSVPLALTIRPPVPTTTTSTGTTTTGGKSTLNAFTQRVTSVDATDSTKETDLFTYEVDETGRLDITSKGGIFFNGQATSALGSSLSGTSGKADYIFATDTGDGVLATANGNIYIAAGRLDPLDTTKGDVHVRAFGCLTAGQGSQKAFFGRKANTVQVGTEADTVQLGGASSKVTSLFPKSFASLTSQPGPDPTATASARPYVTVGPMLILDENHTFSGQNKLDTTGKGFGHTFVALRSRASATNALLEGRLQLIFVPDGTGTGTDTDPYTGTWQIPLAT